MVLVLEPVRVRCINMHEAIHVLCWIWGSQCGELRCNLKKKKRGIGGGKSQLQILRFNILWAVTIDASSTLFQFFLMR